MNYLSIMTEDEIRYVCSIIPLQISVSYFKRYPKDFAKVMPGFRATSFKNQEQVGGILFRSRNHHFISSFIEGHISRWLDEINASIDKNIEEGESKESALLLTLPDCFFVDNIKLYFKLTGAEYSEEFLSIFSNSIRVVKKVLRECQQSNLKLETMTTSISHFESELERTQNEQRKTKKRINEYLDEIKVLKQTNVVLEESVAGIVLLEQKNAELKQKTQIAETYIQQLKAELIDAKNEQIQLKQKIQKEFSKQKEKKVEQDTVQKPKCPTDLDEFRDYLGYNFENIGVPADADYYPLLKDHLCNILFQGKPIIISKSTGLLLMKCISNALIKSSYITTLAFTYKATEQLMEDFLSQSKRILCLDNFIGNCNETLLITLCERHKDKIIFLTVPYDHTLAYVPDELMRYCQYLNLNRIEAFIGDKELTEDPSIVDEDVLELFSVATDIRWSTTLKQILKEVGVRDALSSYKTSLVVNELSLCSWLAFDILPYCTDVLQISPFNTSDRLVKYAGNSSRCPYKNLLRRWFV